MATNANTPGGLSYWDGLVDVISHPIGSVESIFQTDDGISLNGANAITGRMTKEQVDELAGQVRTQVLAAGGSPEDADSAAQQVTGFVGSSEGGTADAAIASGAKLFGGFSFGLLILAGALWFGLRELEKKV